MATISGGCLCGRIRYRSEAAVKFVSLCHCRDCQRFTGSAFAAVIALPKAGLAVDGAMKGFVKRGDSGKTIERFFCPACGTSLMDEAEVVPGLVMIQAGTLDDASWVKPTSQIFCASAQPWLRFDPALILKTFDTAPR